MTRALGPVQRGAIPDGSLCLADMTPDTPVRIETSEQVIQLAVNDVLKWIEPKAPPSEALKFLLTCRAAKLNPFLGEAYLVPMGGKWATVISKAGYLKRAQRHPDYAGHEAGIIIQSFDPKTRARGPAEDVPGTFLPAGYVVVGGWAKVYRTGCERPVFMRLSMAEYGKDSATWKSIPCTMIRKTALVNAIREAFAIGDSYDESESPVEVVKATVVPPPLAGQEGGESGANGNHSGPAAGAASEVDYEGVDEPYLSPATLGRIIHLSGRVGLTDYQINAALAKRGVSHFAELSEREGRAILAKLEERAASLDFEENFPAPAAGSDAVEPVADAGSGPAAGESIATDGPATEGDDLGAADDSSDELASIDAERGEVAPADRVFVGVAEDHEIAPPATRRGRG